MPCRHPRSYPRRRGRPPACNCSSRKKPIRGRVTRSPQSGGGGTVAKGNSAVVGGKRGNGQDGNGRDLHMFVWSSSASPVSDVFGGGGNHHSDYAAATNEQHKDVKISVPQGNSNGMVPQQYYCFALVAPNYFFCKNNPTLSVLLDYVHVYMFCIFKSRLRL